MSFAKEAAVFRGRIDKLIHPRQNFHAALEHQRKFTQADYLKLEFPFPVNGEDMSAKKLPAITYHNDWAPYPNPAAESGRTE